MLIRVEPSEKNSNQDQGRCANGPRRDSSFLRGAATAERTTVVSPVFNTVAIVSAPGTAANVAADGARITVAASPLPSKVAASSVPFNAARIAAAVG